MKIWRFNINTSEAYYRRSVKHKSAQGWLSKIKGPVGDNCMSNLNKNPSTCDYTVMVWYNFTRVWSQRTSFDKTYWNKVKRHLLALINVTQMFPQDLDLSQGCYGLLPDSHRSKSLGTKILNSFQRSIINIFWVTNPISTRNKIFTISRCVFYLPSVRKPSRPLENVNEYLETINIRITVLPQQLNSHHTPGTRRLYLATRI